MGTRADFYIGRGETAEWLGSTAWDGYPDGFNDAAGKPMLVATTEAGFRAAVTALFATRDDVTTPEMGWPWPWNDSRTTDYAYAFDGDAVYASRFGREWFKIDMEAEYYGDDPEADDKQTAIFPDMSSRKNVRHAGPASGLMMIGVTPDGSMRPLTEEEAKPKPDPVRESIMNTLYRHCTHWDEEGTVLYVVDGGMDLSGLADALVSGLKSDLK